MATTCSKPGRPASSASTAAVHALLVRQLGQWQLDRCATPDRRASQRGEDAVLVGSGTTGAGMGAATDPRAIPRRSGWCLCWSTPPFMGRAMSGTQLVAARPCPLPRQGGKAHHLSGTDPHEHGDGASEEQDQQAAQSQAWATPALCRVGSWCRRPPRSRSTRPWSWWRWGLVFELGEGPQQGQVGPCWVEASRRHSATMAATTAATTVRRHGCGESTADGRPTRPTAVPPEPLRRGGVR